MSKAIHSTLLYTGLKCHFCRPKKEAARWRPNTGFLDHKNIACDEHRGDIVEEPEDDGHRTEADYQTWMRL